MPRRISGIFCDLGRSSPPHVLVLKMEQHLVKLLQSNLHLNQFKQIHSFLIRKYYNLSVVFLKNLLNEPFIDYASQVFNHLPQPDAYLYNLMISTYCKHYLTNEALVIFFSMHCNQIQINFYTFPPVLKSCTSLSAVQEGKQVHSLAINYGFDSNLFIQNGLIDFYAKSGDLDSAKRVFDGILVKDPVVYNCLISTYSKVGKVFEAQRLFNQMNNKTIVSWNSMLSCHAHNGDLLEGLKVFEKMQAEKYEPNEITLVTVLSICAKLGDLERGLSVRKIIDNSGLRRNMIVSTAILEMYVKCGAIDEARREFDQMDSRDVVASRAMLAGYAQNGRANEALELFEQMKAANFKPNDVTLVSIASACAQLGSVEAGEYIGNYIESEGLILNAYVRSALLNMYAKCGHIRKARKLFDKMVERDIVSWNAMIRGLAMNGLANDVIALFMEMKKNKVEPDDVTLVGVLTACTHAGFVELGWEFYKSMRTDYNIIPKVEHCACIVDLFCRSGRLEDAYEFVTKMEVEPNVVIWGTLLSACRKNSNVELAQLSAEKLFVLEPENSGNYVLLSNIYASAGKWQEAMKVRKLMKNNRVEKIAAYSWIEMGDVVHKFLVGDTSHPMSEEIYNAVVGLGLQLQSIGYVPHLDLVFS